jgi:hypothetical protein
MNKEEFKELFSEGLKKGNMFHGIAKPLITLKDISKDDVGVITAYLPDMGKFAVHFGGTNWFTFDSTEEEFLKNFEVEMFEE